MTGTGIADHGIIGGLQTAARISSDGWVCSFTPDATLDGATRSVG